jgi:hypothetical protein
MTVFVSHERMGTAPSERAMHPKNSISHFFGSANSRA